MAEQLDSVPDVTGADEAAATVQAAQEQASEEQAAARKAADELLRRLATVFRKGEGDHAKALLTTGKLAEEYIHARLILGDQRSVAVTAIKGRLSEHASGPVDVQELVQCWHAYRLLAEEPGIKLAQPKYGHFSLGWCLLVLRVNKDRPDEAWVLLPGMEQECQATFKECVEAGLSREVVQERVRGIVKRYSTAQAKKAEQAKAEAEQAERERKLQAAKAASEAEKAEAKAANPTGDAEADAKAKAEAEAKTRQAGEAQAAARKAEIDRRVAEAEVKAKAKKAENADKAAATATEKAADKALSKAEREEHRATVRQLTPEGCAQSNPLKQAQCGTVKDAAEFAATVVTGHEKPDDVLEAMLALLHGHKQLSSRAKRAVDAALHVLRNPVAKGEKASVQPVAAA